MNEQLKNILKDLKDSLPEEWKGLLDNPDKAKAKLSKFARELPAELYEVVRDRIIPELLYIEEPSMATLNFVVDSNIIVSDSFRVGRGKQSSTARIFSSAFVKLYAPKSIEREVFTQIKEDLPNDCSLEVATNNAKRLLSKIELVDDSKFEVEYSELPKFQKKFGNDVSFLKLGIGLGVKKIISRDKAFDESSMIKRFDLGGAVKLIVSAESGALSLSVIGGATYVGAEGIYWLLILLYKVLTEIYAFLAVIVSVGITGLASVFENAPKWMLYIILAFLGGTGIALAISKDLREKAINKITDLYEWVNSKSAFALGALSNLLKGLIDIAVTFKDELGPYFMNVGLAMILSITEMKEVFESQ